MIFTGLNVGGTTLQSTCLPKPTVWILAIDLRCRRFTRAVLSTLLLQCHRSVTTTCRKLSNLTGLAWPECESSPSILQLLALFFSAQRICLSATFGVSGKETLDKTAYTDEQVASRLLTITESAHPLPPATKTQLAATIIRLLSQASSGRLTDPVAKVLFSRLKQHVFARISASSSNERVRAISTASERLSAAGLPEFGSVVSEMVDLLAVVGDADRKSHGVWYERIAAENEHEISDAGEGGVTPRAVEGDSKGKQPMNQY